MPSEVNIPLKPVSALIRKYGIPAVLRAITAFCQADYEKRCKAYYEKFDSSDADSAEARLARDLRSALVGVNLDYQAENYERAISEAGWTEKQRCEAGRSKEIEQTKAKLKQLQNTKCAENFHGNLY